MELGMRYFTLEQRESLQHWLEDRAAVLQAELGDDLKADLNAEPELAAAKRDADELREIEATLVRLHQPDFGACSRCGADIPFARLKANPVARLCLICQDQQEHDSGLARG